MFPDSRPPSVVPTGLGAYLAPGPSSFTDFVTAHVPHLLPGHLPEPAAGEKRAGAPVIDHRHGTTIVALVFADGVIMAGDRRATSGNVIAQRDIEKVFVTDQYSAVGIAGAAGIALQMVRLFSVDLEHYEKTEGVGLSLEGKANKLAGMVAQNLGAALQGFVVVPLFVGYDTEKPPAQAGRIVTYDATGGRYDEWLGYHSVGSGSVFAKSSLKKLWKPEMDEAGAIRILVESLYDAADDDSATGGPDLVRGIFPTAVVIGADGAEEVAESRIAELAREIIESRSRSDTFGPDAHHGADARGDS
jgi:proteasome beta subunit